MGKRWATAIGIHRHRSGAGRVARGLHEARSEEVDPIWVG
jgi:hypothetical protein